MERLKHSTYIKKVIPALDSYINYIVHKHKHFDDVKIGVSLNLNEPIKNVIYCRDVWI